MTSRRSARPPRPAVPHRTCVACRQVRPQGELIRVTRAPAGTLEADPDRRRGGRGAYVCPRQTCLDESVRRGRFAHAFRAATVATSDAVERLHRLLDTAVPGSTMCSMPSEGRG